MNGAIVHSALYRGWVQHRRFAPRAHAFSYRMGLLYLDLAEQDAVLGLSPLSGRGRFAPSPSASATTCRSTPDRASHWPMPCASA